jgi:hypothetical protein
MAVSDDLLLKARIPAVMVADNKAVDEDSVRKLH